MNNLRKLIYPFSGYTNPHKPDESSRPQPPKPMYPPAYPKPQDHQFDNKIKIKMKTLTELTVEYYTLINKDHHKDRDCHFYIQKIYSYGNEHYWQFLHYGYCWSAEKFFKDEENIKKYQEYFNQSKGHFEDLKTNPIVDSDGEEHYLAFGDFYLSEFPKRQTEQEAEQDMRNFLEWIIEEEKQVKDE